MSQRLKRASEALLITVAVSVVCISGVLFLGNASASRYAAWETQHPPPTLDISTYTTTLTLPTGEMLPVECRAISGSMNSPFCQAVFPNGNRLSLSDGLKWSPDGYFGVNCRDMTHDSPCSFFELWDVKTGSIIGELRYSDWHRWLDDKEHTLAVIRDPIYANIKPKMVLWDVATNIEMAPESCAEWLSAEMDKWALDTCRRSLQPAQTE